MPLLLIVMAQRMGASAVDIGLIFSAGGVGGVPGSLGGGRIQRGLVLPFFGPVTLQGNRMTTTLTTKGQVTIPKRIRDELQLLPGAPVQFSVNAAGEVVLHRPRPAKGLRRPQPDRFDAVRGRADVRWRTDELMKLLRTDD